MNGGLASDATETRLQIEVVGVADGLDATLGRGGDLLEGLAGQVGQLPRWGWTTAPRPGWSAGAPAGSGPTTSQDRAVTWRLLDARMRERRVTVVERRERHG